MYYNKTFPILSAKWKWELLYSYLHKPMEIITTVLPPRRYRLMVIKKKMHDVKNIIVAWVIKEPVTFVFYSSIPGRILGA